MVEVLAKQMVRRGLHIFIPAEENLHFYKGSTGQDLEREASLLMLGVELDPPR